MKYQKYLDKFESLEGKTYVVTGANSGIGFDTSRYLASKGAKVIMLCRFLERANTAKEKILKETPSAQLEIVRYDQASFESIKETATSLKDTKFDGVLFNAGVFYPPEGMKTKEDLPLTVGVNFVGCIYFYSLLSEYIKDFDNIRCVFVNSIAHYFVRSRKALDYLYNDKYSLWNQYCVSKRLLTSYLLDLIKEGKKNISLAHPGIASTSLFNRNDSSFGRSFGKFATKVIGVILNNSECAALALFGALIDKEGNKYYIPSSLFHWARRPKTSRFPKYKKNPKLREAVENLIKEKAI